MAKSISINPKVLVIDDDVDLAHTLKETLVENGIPTTIAFNGKEGVSYLVNSPYDLIITDIVMPEMDGLEVIMWVRKNKPNTKLLAVSGSGYFSSMNLLKLAKELGAHRTLGKPIDYNLLLKSVEDLLRENEP